MELGIRIPEDLGTAVSQDMSHALHKHVYMREKGQKERKGRARKERQSPAPVTSLPKKTARNKTTPGTVVGMRWERVPLVFTWCVDAVGFWQGKRDWHCKHVSAWAHLEKKRWCKIIASVREWLRQRDGEGSGCSLLQC